VDGETDAGDTTRKAFGKSDLIKSEIPFKFSFGTLSSVFRWK
jgi:hypothetical protein